MNIINKKIVISILFILGVCSIIFIFILFKTNNKMVIKRVFKVNLPENAEIIECSKKNDYYAAKVKMSESDIENFTKSLDNWILVNLSLAKSSDDLINNQRDTFAWWNLNFEDVEYYYTKFETKNSLFGLQKRHEYFIFITKEVNNEIFVYFIG